VPRARTKADSAAGKLISAVQKVWAYRFGTDQAAEADAVMNRAHDLHLAILAGRLDEVLSGRTIRDYLGADWIMCHPGVDKAVKSLESAVGGV
jgi:hypothetical protein